MTELIKEEFTSGLDSLKWMSSETKKNARIKVQLFTAIAFPKDSRVLLLDFSRSLSTSPSVKGPL